MEAIITAPAAFDSFTDYYQIGLAHFPQQFRSGGSFEIKMMQVQQASAELIDPPVDQFTIIGLISPSARVEFDAGDGWGSRIQVQEKFFGAQPANQVYGIRMYDPVHFFAAYALIIGVMNNGMSIMGIGIDWQQVIQRRCLDARCLFGCLLQKQRLAKEICDARSGECGNDARQTIKRRTTCKNCICCSWIGRGGAGNRLKECGSLGDLCRLPLLQKCECLLSGVA